jgi:hypothetical protein
MAQHEQIFRNGNKPKFMALIMADQRGKQLQENYAIAANLSAASSGVGFDGRKTS